MRQTHFALMAVILLLVEILIALFATGGTFLRASFGDFLVVILIYCSVRAVVYVDPLKLAIAVCLFAFAVEFAQYYQVVDRLNITSQFWRVVIGTSFSVGDLVMYAGGCVTIYVIDCVIAEQKSGNP